MNEKEKQREAENSERERLRRELEESFSYDNYLVARKELFAHLRDPAIVIRPDSITFNQACIDGLPDVVYIRLSVNEQLHRIGLPEFYRFLFSPNEKRFAIEACNMNDPGAYRFSGLPRSRRRSYQQTSLGLLEGLYERCSWDKARTYTAEGEVLFGGKMVLFDLKEAQMERKE